MSIEFVFEDSVQQCDEQIKGACMLPKFGLDLMKCEVDRLVLLTRNSIFPLSYFVPRRVRNPLLFNHSQRFF